MRRRVLIIAPHGSYRTAPFIDAAARLDVDVLIASEGEHSVVSAYANGLHIHPEDLDESLARVLRAAADQPFAAIIGTDDGTTELAARAARALGLPHNEPEAVRIARRKDLARACLAGAGVRVPRHARLQLSAPLAPQAAAVGFPAVIKPLTLSASRGVMRVDDAEQLQQAGRRLRLMLGSMPELPRPLREHALLEAFVPGVEVAVEGMLTNERLEVLAIFDKPDPLDGPFFEETYYVTPTRLDPKVQQEVRQTIGAACRAYGLREGPIHAECRINEAGVWVIEVAARTIGGLCARLLRLGTGYGLEELVLAQALARPLPVTIRDEASGVLMIPIRQAGVFRRVEGVSDARRIPWIEDLQLQIREGHELVPWPEGTSYLGFLFARAPTPALVEQALREAHACLNIVVAPLWRAQVA